MAAFIYGDQPVATFDYGLPEAIESADSVALSVNGQTIAATLDGADIIGDWQTLTLPAVGAYPVYLAVTVGERTQRFQVDTLVVVASYDPWFNVVTARFEWDGAPEDDGTLYRLLALAQEQVEAFAPPIFGSGIPERFRSAQLLQARNTLNGFQVDNNGAIDLGSGTIITPRPLDWTVKNMIRPAKALKAVG